MVRLFTLAATAAALLFSRADFASAQAACPTSNRLSFVHTQNGSVLNATNMANKRLAIHIGSFQSGQSYVNFAVIKDLNANTCGTYWLSYNEVSLSATLTQHTNLCLGNQSDFIDNDQQQGLNTVECNGTVWELLPMAYNGFRLQTYLGGGSDHVHMSTGVDRVYGAYGNDDISDMGGVSDRFYGEGDPDTISCRESSAPTCDGGGAIDVIDAGNSGSALVYGGTSSDHIEACGVWTLVDCGDGGSDVVQHGSNMSLVNCETKQQVCP